MASEYRRHAAECRSLAARMLSEVHREQLLTMAATWERMAETRERMQGASISEAPPGPGAAPA